MQSDETRNKGDRRAAAPHRPVALGAGERLFDGVPALDLELVSARPASLVTHITYRVRR
ncbi:hypothetical protein AB0H34_21530 [Saccharopolyspora shandongensis]|uniref:hypothetical protein n=1 Tax=Saccharopolyspora shandongensis TaxID=418495 RepID=UPI0033F22239